MVQHIHITGIIFQVSFVFLPLYHAPPAAIKGRSGSGGKYRSKRGQEGADIP